MKIFKKKLGIGSLSLFLFLIAFILLIQYLYFSIGDQILYILGTAPWLPLDFANPLGIYISVLLTVPSIILGYVYKDHFGARIGRSLSLTLVALIIVWYLGFDLGYSTLSTQLFK